MALTTHDIPIFRPATGVELFRKVQEISRETTPKQLKSSLRHPPRRRSPFYFLLSLPPAIFRLITASLMEPGNPPRKKNENSHPRPPPPAIFRLITASFRIRNSAGAISPQRSHRRRCRHQLWRSAEFRPMQTAELTLYREKQPARRCLTAANRAVTPRPTADPPAAPCASADRENTETAAAHPPRGRSYRRSAC